MSVASVHIHVERAIGRIKTYHILDGTLSNTLSSYASLIDKLSSPITKTNLPTVVEMKYSTA